MSSAWSAKKPALQRPDWVKSLFMLVNRNPTGQILWLEGVLVDLELCFAVLPALLFAPFPAAECGTPGLENLFRVFFFCEPDKNPPAGICLAAGKN